MKLIPSVHVKHFEACEPGELIRFLNADGNSSYGVVVTQLTSWQETEKIICEFRDEEVQLSDYTLGDHVISFGTRWELLLSEFDVRTLSQGNLQRGTVILVESKPCWYIGKGDPATNGVRGVSIAEAQVKNIPFSKHVARSWAIRLPPVDDRADSVADLVTFSTKPAA